VSGNAETNIEEKGEGGAGVPISTDYCNVVKKVKKDNITTDNIGQIILSQIPGIGATAAISIMKGFRSFPHFMQSIRENPTILDNIRVENGGKSRKLGKNCIQSIKAYLMDFSPIVNEREGEPDDDKQQIV
jgi:transposase